MAKVAPKTEAAPGSLRRSFVWYLAIALLIAVLISMILILLLDQVQDAILERYKSENLSPYLSSSIGSSAAAKYLRLSTADARTLNFCAVLQWVLIPVLFVASCLIAFRLFYRNKIARPLAQLQIACEKMAERDLDFSITYQSKDEIGQICQDLEHMRAYLSAYIQDANKAVEARTRLAAAFSHDMRTPLTVLQGHTEMLLKYYPQGKIDQQRLMSTLSTMSENISRLSTYVSNMNMLQRLEDVSIQPEETDLAELAEQMRELAEILCHSKDLALEFKTNFLSPTGRLDRSVAMQIFENLLSNGIRHARRTLQITLSSDSASFFIFVADDGAGFSGRDLKSATEPFYRGRSATDGPHFGLGLNICRLLCEKHNGSLTVTNGFSSGGLVEAQLAFSPAD